jgi:hypothetical protein
VVLRTPGLVDLTASALALVGEVFGIDQASDAVLS